MALKNIDRCEGTHGDLIQSTIKLTIKYCECFNGPDSLHLHELYFELMSLLTINEKALMSQEFKTSRTAIFFCLSNYFEDIQMYLHLVPAQFHFYNREPA